MRYEPANSIIIKLGGLTRVARITGCSPNGVMRWRMPKDKGGSGGAIPHWHVPKLMAEAVAIGVDLPPSAFFEAIPPSIADNDENGTTATSRPVPNTETPAQEASR